MAAPSHFSTPTPSPALLQALHVEFIHQALTNPQARLTPPTSAGGYAPCQSWPPMLSGWRIIWWSMSRRV
ncbi:hypothetical protein CALVIDRAFT_543230 [Calocera viscosa TUFC12733]|uniref:Uncharacterized protein n=1 Tax=Calocera viscosa (strain TUFC12733) TaxID=1330018 RepID=A0A167FUK5_CALVF|nr:hypothetical protein CALVIDRAFT_543230 [Calocera viscosa TUFC12733]